MNRVTKEKTDTPIKKYRNSCWCLKRLDDTYTAVGLYDTLLSLLLYARQTGKMSSYFSSDISCLTEEYLKREGIELNNVVSDKSRCFKYYDTLRGTVQVESRKKYEKVRYDVEFCDLVTKGSEKADISFKSFVFLDPCPLSRKVCGRVVSWDVRKAYNDNRTGSSIPSPHIRVLIDNHGAIGMHWLVEEKECEDFDIFGFKPHTIRIIERNKEHIFSDEDVHEKNLYFRDTELPDPLNRRVGLPIS